MGVTVINYDPPRVHAVDSDGYGGDLVSFPIVRMNDSPSLMIIILPILPSPKHHVTYLYGIIEV